MADIDRIKGNLGKMIEQGAPESDINAYLSTEGYSSPEAWRSALSTPGVKPKTVGAAMVQESPRLEAGPRTSTMPDPGRPWGEVLSSGARNFLPSVGNAVLGSVNALTIGLPKTVEGMYDLGKGVVTKINRYQPAPGQTTMGPRPPTPEQAESEATADAVGSHYATKYGTAEGFKNALADDPGSILMDAATLGTAGAGLPGKTGQVAGIISKADPLTATGNALKYGAKGAELAGSNVLGMTTGAGTESIRAAGRAGREGGEAAKTFTEHMRGAPVSEVVDRAKTALDQVRQERGKQYRSGMVDISKDVTVLDFAPIDAALAKADDVAKFRPSQAPDSKGVRVNRSAGETNDAISTIVNDWKTLNPKSPLFKDIDPAELTPANYHTPEGLDALKRIVGDIRNTVEPGSSSMVAANTAYNAIKGEIVKQAPAYAKVMEDYEKASNKITETSKTFSLSKMAGNDTASRKLLSATRNNVQTNYGERGRMLNSLAEFDPTLPDAIAGQSLNALAPRGLVGRGGAMMALGGAVADPVSSLAYLAASSPRIVGETVYAGGKAIGFVEDLAASLGVTPARIRALGQAGYQAGRPEDIRQRAMSLRETNALAAP
jgi:hypothetical protein